MIVPAASGRPAGAVAAIVLLIFVGYTVWLHIRDEFYPNSGFVTVLLVLLALWIVKTLLLPLFPGFGPDVGTYQAWAARVRDLGPARLYEHGFFLDYPPGYIYALWVAAIIARLVGAAGTAYRMLVESPPLCADFVLAAVFWAYVRRGGRPYAALAAMLLLALNPAFLYDDIIWGQSDSVLTLILFLSTLSVLADEYELAWGMGALGLLIKPQALMFLPVLGLWTLFNGNWRKWLRSAATFIAILLIGAAPFQIGHKWNWIISLYTATAAYYHETSVNAFNFMALIGGLRRPDSGTLLGVSYFTIGMSLLVPLYAFVAWVLWRSRSSRALFYAIFIALFGFFMVAPRMHERYVYPALLFALPLALESYQMLLIFGVVTATFLFNMAYVKHALQTIVFLPAHDAPAMLVAVINLVMLALAVRYGFELVRGTGVPAETAAEPRAPARFQKFEIDPGPGPLAARAGAVSAAVAVAAVPAAARAAEPSASPAEQFWRAAFARLIPSLAARAPEEAARYVAADAARSASAVEPRAPLLEWARLDTIAIAALIAAAAAMRFWHLGHPNAIVFDEVHFVGQARHYLRGEFFLDPHPPLAKLIIALGIMIFGDHAWAWRVGNATLGTALVAITYLLGRRMFRSRLAAALAACFVMCDGLFLVDSRVAVIDIVYLTFAALSYLLLFRFMQSHNPHGRRVTLLLMGIALGLCVGSKLYIPAVTFLLVMGFLIYVILRPEAAGVPYERDLLRRTHLAGALLLSGSVAALTYLACFWPHFYWGWWAGIGDLFHYYGQVVWYEHAVAHATHPYASKWWSWPFMFRPVAYWQNFPAHGPVSTIWGGGNPVTWWGALTAMIITLALLFERPTLERAFLVIGYFGYLVIWIPVGRTLFLYHYMGSVYLGYLALGWVVKELWEGAGESWMSLAMVLTLAPAALLGMGNLIGGIVFAILALVWGALVGFGREHHAARWVAGAFVVAGLAAFIYFFPVWTAIPIDRASYYARMWLKGPGIRNWI